MKNLVPILSFLILVSFAYPIITSAATDFNLIVCKGTQDDPCNLPKLIDLFKNIITALVEVATVVTTIALIFMGIKLMTSSGNPSAMTDVKNRAMGIVKGYVLILAAWLIVYTILTVLVDKKYILLTPK